MVLTQTRAIRTENKVARGHTFLMYQARFSQHQTSGQHHVQGPPDRSRASLGFARGLGCPPVLRTDPRPAQRRPRPPRRPQTKRTATVGFPRVQTRRGTPGRTGYLTYPGTSRLPDAPRRPRFCPNATATRPDCSRGRALPDPEVHRHSSGTFRSARWWKLLRPKRGGTRRRECRDVRPFGTVTISEVLSERGDRCLSGHLLSKLSQCSGPRCPLHPRAIGTVRLPAHRPDGCEWHQSHAPCRLRPRRSRPPVSAISWPQCLAAGGGCRREHRRKASGYLLGLVTQDEFCIYGLRRSFRPARRGTVNRKHCRELNCMVAVINRRNGTRVFYSLAKRFLA